MNASPTTKPNRKEKKQEWPYPDFRYSTSETTIFEGLGGVGPE